MPRHLPSRSRSPRTRGGRPRPEARSARRRSPRRRDTCSSTASVPSEPSSSSATAVRTTSPADPARAAAATRASPRQARPSCRRSHGRTAGRPRARASNGVAIACDADGVEMRVQQQRPAAAVRAPSRHRRAAAHALDDSHVGPATAPLDESRRSRSPAAPGRWVERVVETNAAVSCATSPESRSGSRASSAR